MPDGPDSVFIPVSESNTWPLDISYGGDRIAISLFRHGMISHRIHAELVPDKAVNDKFGIGITTMP